MPYFAYFEKHDRKMVSENSSMERPKTGYYSLIFPAGLWAHFISQVQPL